MFKPVQRLVVYCWDFVFNHEVSPLRHIPDVAIRHYVLQALGLMWAAAFAVATGSYTFLAVSVLGHTILIAAAAITVARRCSVVDLPSPAPALTTAMQLSFSSLRENKMFVRNTR